MALTRRIAMANKKTNCSILIFPCAVQAHEAHDMLDAGIEIDFKLNVMDLNTMCITIYTQWTYKVYSGAIISI